MSLLEYKKQYLPIVHSTGPLEFAGATAAFVALGLAIATFVNSRKNHYEIINQLQNIENKLEVSDGVSNPKNKDNSDYGDDFNEKREPHYWIWSGEEDPETAHWSEVKDQSIFH